MRKIPTAALLALAISVAACADAERTADAGVEVASDALGAIEPSTEPPGAAAAIPPSGDSRMDGFGSLDFGLSADEAREDWNGNPLESAGPVDDPMACHQLVPAGQANPGELSFMFEDDLFVRYSVGTDAFTAPGGGRVGMDQAALEGLYGKGLESMRHKYIEGGTMLMSQEDGGSLPSRLAFELDAEGRVVAWRVGLAPQVGYVEGCG